MKISGPFNELFSQVVISLKKAAKSKRIQNLEAKKSTLF